MAVTCFSAEPINLATFDANSSCNSCARSAAKVAPSGVFFATKSLFPPSQRITLNWGGHATMATQFGRIRQSFGRIRIPLRVPFSLGWIQERNAAANSGKKQPAGIGTRVRMHGAERQLRAAGGAA